MAKSKQLTILSVFLIYLASTRVVANEISLEECNHETREARGISLYNGEVKFQAVYRSNQYILRDCHRNIITLDMGHAIELGKAADFSSQDAFFDSGNSRSAVSVHWAAQRLYDFYQEKFKWKGFNNTETPLVQYVHYGFNYFNAQFDKGVVIYGDGGLYNSSAIVSVDYVGHEISHGISASTAQLTYQGESGALNESFSDILGKSFEIWLTSEKRATWDMFPDIYRDPIMSTRSMSAPQTEPVDKSHPTEFLENASKTSIKTVLRQQPQFYRGPFWYFGSNDAGGVHTNSGVQNYWYYLLVNGGKGKNHLGLEYDLKGIGLEKALQIAWRNLTVYLKADSKYIDARYGSEQAAIDLFGTNSIEYQIVQRSWDAVAVVEENLEQSPQPDKNIIELSMRIKDGDHQKVIDASVIGYPHIEGVRVDKKNSTQQWLLASSSSVEDYAEFVGYQNWQFAAGHSYEIRFTQRGGLAIFTDATGTSETKPVPFEVWMLGDDLDIELDDVRMIPVVFDIDKDGRFGLFSDDLSPYRYTKDHPGDPDDNDPWTDMIHIAAPKDETPGDKGYQQFVVNGLQEKGEQHLQWLTLIAKDISPLKDASSKPILPDPGTIFRIVTSHKRIPAYKPLRPTPILLDQ